MERSGRIAFVASAIVAVALIALVIVTTDGPGGAKEPSAEDLAPFYDQTLVWRSCGDGVECAKATVPVDYFDPSGPTITLALKRVPGQAGATRTLFINPGGPGESGAGEIDIFGSSLSKALGGEYAIVGFDPRGVGASSPLDCLTDAQLDAWNARPAAPRDEKAWSDLADQVQEFADGCERQAGSLAAHVSTVEVARDLDVLRDLVGDEKLDYLGQSYGTAIGSVYANLFPSRVGRMVLDGAEDPALSGVEAQRSQLAGFEIALTAYIEDCVSQPDCPLGNDENAASEKIGTFLDGLATTPLKTDDPKRPLTDSRAAIAIVSQLYAREEWPLLSFALRSAIKDRDGDLLGLFGDQYLRRLDDGSYEDAGNLAEANQAISCLDSASRDPAVAEAAVDEFRRLSPIGPIWASIAGVCELWPITATAPIPPIAPEGAPPILVVGTTRDDATPYSQAVALTKALGSGVLLTYDGDGHLAYQRGYGCIDRWVNRYLLTGSTPPEGTTCRQAPASR